MNANQRQIKEVPFRVHYTSASHKTDWLFKMQTYALKKTTKLASVLLNLANNNKKNLIRLWNLWNFITQTSSMIEKSGVNYFLSSSG